MARLEYCLHISAVFSADVIQRMADLPERMGFHGFHQRGEEVRAVTGGSLEVAET